MRYGPRTLFRFLSNSSTQRTEYDKQILEKKKKERLTLFPMCSVILHHYEPWFSEEEEVTTLPASFLIVSGMNGFRFFIIKPNLFSGGDYSAFNQTKRWNHINTRRVLQGAKRGTEQKQQADRGEKEMYSQEISQTIRGSTTGGSEGTSSPSW
eukprot:gene12202-8397_t